MIAVIPLNINPDTTPNNTAGHIHILRISYFFAMAQYAMLKHRHVKTLGKVVTKTNSVSKTSGGLVLVCPGGAALDNITNQTGTMAKATARLVK